MIRTPEEIKLDNKALTFGKHSFKTPEQIAESDPQYIVWGYGNIKNRPFCSYPLAVKCGYVDMSRDPSAKDLPLHDRSVSMRDNPYRVNSPSRFDDMDDDIPF